MDDMLSAETWKGLPPALACRDTLAPHRTVAQSVSYTVNAQATRLASMKSAVTRALVPAGRTPSAQ